jgi:hypothetical protein
VVLGRPAISDVEQIRAPAAVAFGTANCSTREPRNAVPDATIEPPPLSVSVKICVAVGLIAPSGWPPTSPPVACVWFSRLIEAGYWARRRIGWNGTTFPA